MVKKYPQNQGDRRAGDELADLARRAAAGDQAAFESLYRRLGPAVLRMLASRLRGDEHLAEDLSQRTWAGLWRSLHSGRYDPTRSAITTYVYAVAYRTWLHHMRQTAADRSRPVSFDVEIVAESPPPDEAASLAQMLELVRQALRGPTDADLGEDEQEILRAIGAGESDRAIAKRLGLAPSTINARKQAALGKLRRILARKGFRSEAGERTDPQRKEPGDAPPSARDHT